MFVLGQPQILDLSQPRHVKRMNSTVSNPKNSFIEPTEHVPESESKFNVSMIFQVLNTLLEVREVSLPRVQAR